MASSPSPLPPPSNLSSPSVSPKQDLLLLPPSESKPLSPPKKSPPIPWSHQETVAVIQAYQEKWYSLKKGPLKAFQWEEIAITVAARCGFDEPSKTNIQCRHKIEKLRKRYRSELQKPYPNAWHYFQLMDQLENGPVPLNARPIAAVKSSPNTVNSNSPNFNYGYGGLYSASGEHYYNHNNNSNNYNVGSRGDGVVASDESDEEWNTSYGLDAMARNKSKSVNNIVRGNAIRSGKGVAMDRGFGGGVSALRNRINGKRKEYYRRDYSDDDGGGDGDDDFEEDVEEWVQAEEGGGEGVTELAAEIRGFAETFMRIESKKIEMMRETERNRMEMEKKRMEMILDAQRKITDSISRAFGAHKKVDQEL